MGENEIEEKQKAQKAKNRVALSNESQLLENESRTRRRRRRRRTKQQPRLWYPRVPLFTSLFETKSGLSCANLSACQPHSSEMFDRPELVLAEVRSLLQAELFDSAEALVSFYLSATQSGEPVAENSSAAISAKMLLADFHEASGDALFGKKEFKRACSAFQSAELAGKGQPSSKAKLPFSAVSSSGEAKLRFKQALCLHELKEPGSALKCLETIPAKYRTLGIHKMMGDLYCESNLKRNAIGCYKEALLLQPLAVEIAERLVDLGVESSEVLQTLQSAAECRPAQDQAAATPSWLSSLILAFAHRKSSDHRRALSVLKDLNGSFPRNLYLLSQTARTSAGLLGQTDNTLMIFRHIHKLDRHYVQDMDLFAGLLHSRGEEAELNKLASSLIEGAPSLPQTWLAAGWYCASKGDLDNALSFVDKAIILAPHHGESFLAKGQMQTKQGSPELALISFSQAHSLEKSLSSMLGLIESNLLLGKLKEAANWSRECLRQFPKAPEAYWAMGNVLAKSPGAPHEVRAPIFGSNTQLRTHAHIFVCSRPRRSDFFLGGAL